MKNNKLYILVGIPGSGKSTYLEQNSFNLCAVSPDTIREVFLAPDINANGYMTINNKENDKIFSILKHQILPNKLKSGSPIFIDATNLNSSDITDYKEIAKNYLYETEVIDFGLKDFEFYKDRNTNRPLHKQLSEDRLADLYEVRKNLVFNQGVKVNTPEEVAISLSKTADDLIMDVSDYNKIHFIGDIQGCYTVLNNFIKENKVKEDEFFVFIGDYIDRGEENAEVLEFLEQHMHRDNFLFLKGNHEENLYKYAVLNSDKGLSPIFVEKTLPELIEKGFTKERIQNIYNNLEEVSYLKYNNTKILVSHGGLNTIPKQPMLLGKDVNNDGYGFYTANIDGIFDTYADKNWVQVHGHRNSLDLPSVASERSFNLEGSVEYGEDLRVLTFEKGLELIPIVRNFKNDVYTKGELKMGEVELEFNERLEGLNEIKHSGDLLTNLRDNPLINESVSETYPHISSFNFSKKAFYESSTSFLQELVSQSRGLFINTESGEVVSRGFEKFFNIGELESSSMKSIEENFTFPLTLYKKENGFFGTIGYDSKTDNLVVTSKSRIEGDFPDLFNKIVDEQFSQTELNKLKRYAQKYNVNYIFEVNDPENDPHIVEYDKKHVVLLAIVKRDFKFQDVKYDSLVSFSQGFQNLPVKQMFATFNNMKAFEGFHNAVMSGKKDVDYEGFVVEDAKSNKVKIKAPYYSNWKFMRGAVDYYKKAIERFEKGITKNFKSVEDLEKTLKTSTFSKIDDYNFIVPKMKVELKEFYTWFLDQSKEVKNENIISLRNKFKEQQTIVNDVKNDSEVKAKKVRRKM